MKQTDDVKEEPVSEKKNENKTNSSSSSTPKPNSKLDANAATLPPTMQSIEPTKKKSDTKML